MRTRGRWLHVGAALICSIGAGCTSTPGGEPATAPPLWAAAAETYFAAFHEAESVGYTNLAPFYAPDALVDYGLMNYDGVGRTPAVQALRDMAQDLPVTFGGRDPTDASTWTPDEPLHVSREGAVDVTRLTAAGLVVPSASEYEVHGGLIDAQVWAGSVQAGEDYVELVRAPQEEIALDYVAAWSAGDPGAVAGRYAPQAQVRDTILDVDLQGLGPIREAATASWAEGGLLGVELRQIRQDGGPAVYVNASSNGRATIDRMIILLHSDAAGGCPGEVAVSLQLDGSTIRSERRYHRVDSARRCIEDLPSGWWEDVQIPNPREFLRTGTVTAGGLEVAIWNGTPDPSPLILWGLQRFADAGLPPPIPTSVTFLPRGDDPWLDHGFDEGTTAPDLALPFPASDACLDAGCTRWPTATKAVLLHQLAHLYLSDPWYPRWEDPLIGPLRLGPFLADHGVTWLDPASPWEGQGSQLAAETVAWGLMDEPFSVDARMGGPTCAELGADFAVLTGSSPGPRSCADVTAGSGLASELSPPAPAPPPSPITGTAAPSGGQLWFTAYYAALDRGLLDLYGYYSPDVRMDYRTLGMGITTGRDALRDHLTTSAGAILLQRNPVGPLYVSRSGAVTVAGLPGSSTAAFVMSLAPTGITSETYAPALVTLRRARPDDERLVALQRSAESYVAAWSGQEPKAVAGRYSPEARITDDVLGIAATDDDLRALAIAAPDTGGLPAMALVSLADLGGPAVFATGDISDEAAPLDTVILLLTSAQGCPGNVAIVLRLDDRGRITEETRLHSDAELGGCAVPTPGADAWWDGLAIPPGISVDHSGTLTLLDRPVEVRNSSPALERLLTWGIQRFADADLVAPAVDSVTFVDRKAPACTRINGLAAGADVSLCFGTADACADDGCLGWRPWAKATLLHELSHVWLSQNLDPATRDRFQRVAGLSTWESADVPWGERGVELAAETMAGSLTDERVPLNVKVQRRYSSADLADLFDVLTSGPR